MSRLATPSPVCSHLPAAANAELLPLLNPEGEVEVDDNWPGHVSGVSTPLLTADARDGDVEGASTASARAKVGKWAITCLLLQHVSSTFGNGSYNFAAFLFLIEVYRDTLVAASLVGFFTTCSGLFLSGYVGGMVDRTPRLQFVRRAVGAQKMLFAANYGLFMCKWHLGGAFLLADDLRLFGPLRDVASEGFHGRGKVHDIMLVWSILLLTVAFSSLLGLANTGLTVAVERDWVATIAEGDSAMLTRLNTSIRRIDLTSKLCSPLVVSLLTTLWGYKIATVALLAFSLITAVTEHLWIGVVYSHFPSLANQHPREAAASTESTEHESWKHWLRREADDWAEFVRLPVFGSSVAIATIYLTTLSYDGMFIAYVKAARGWDDNFVALMRGVCVLTGLMGTAVMPVLERRIGLERAGAWSIWFEAACLFPSLLSFFYGTGQYGEHGSAINSIMLFGGIAISRIGLWSFDLCQLKVLQLATEHHPRRNRLAALQIALQNLFDLAKYVVTLVAASPAQFKWTALVSYGAVIAGAIAYVCFLRAMRGHLVHLGWLKKKIC